MHISGVTKFVKKFLTLSKSSHCASVKKFVTHFVTPETWTLINVLATCVISIALDQFIRMYVLTHYSETLSKLPAHIPAVLLYIKRKACKRNRASN